MKLYKLQKVVVKVKDLKLIDDLSSNTLDKPRNALLDFAGRIVVVFDQIKLDDSLLIVVNQDFYFELVQYLAKQLAKIDVEMTKLKAYFDLENNFNIEHNDFRIPQKKGQIILTEKELETNVSEEEFTTFRVQNNIPLQGIDFKNDMVLNVSDEFVSLKGCYPGQEVIARVTNYSKPPLKLVVVNKDKVPEEEKKKMTSAVEIDRSKKGFLFLRDSSI